MAPPRGAMPWTLAGRAPLTRAAFLLLAALLLRAKESGAHLMGIATGTSPSVPHRLVFFLATYNHGSHDYTPGRIGISTAETEYTFGFVHLRRVSSFAPQAAAGTWAASARAASAGQMHGGRPILGPDGVVTVYREWTENRPTPVLWARGLDPTESVDFPSNWGHKSIEFWYIVVLDNTSPGFYSVRMWDYDEKLHPTAGGGLPSVDGNNPAMFDIGVASGAPGVCAELSWKQVPLAVAPAAGPLCRAAPDGVACSARCAAGFVQVGQLRCEAGRWNPSFACHARQSTCGDPREYAVALRAWLVGGGLAPAPSAAAPGADANATANATETAPGTTTTTATTATTASPGTPTATADGKPRNLGAVAATADAAPRDGDEEADSSAATTATGTPSLTSTTSTITDTNITTTSTATAPPALPWAELGFPNASLRPDTVVADGARGCGAPVSRSSAACGFTCTGRGSVALGFLVCLDGAWAVVGESFAACLDPRDNSPPPRPVVTSVALGDGGLLVHWARGDHGGVARSPTFAFRFELSQPPGSSLACPDWNSGWPPAAGVVCACGAVAACDPREAAVAVRAENSAGLSELSDFARPPCTEDLSQCRERQGKLLSASLPGLPQGALCSGFCKVEYHEPVPRSLVCNRTLLQPSTYACEPAPCPAGATPSGPGGQCLCQAGYRGVLAWSRAEHRYSGACEKVPCPPNAQGDPLCVCPPGFAGRPLWDNRSLGYTDMCRLVACQPGAALHWSDQLCRCGNDHAGSLRWVPKWQYYDGICLPVTTTSTTTTTATSTWLTTTSTSTPEITSTPSTTAAASASPTTTASAPSMTPAAPMPSTTALSPSTTATAPPPTTTATSTPTTMSTPPMAAASTPSATAAASTPPMTSASAPSTTATAPPPTTTATSTIALPAAADGRAVVVWRVRVTNVEFQELAARPAVLAEFWAAIRGTLAGAAGVPAEHVRLVSLAPGSVVTDVAIAVPEGAAPELRRALASPALPSSLATAVRGIRGVALALKDAAAGVDVELAELAAGGGAGAATGTGAAVGTGAAAEGAATGLMLGLEVLLMVAALVPGLHRGLRWVTGLTAALGLQALAHVGFRGFWLLAGPGLPPCAGGGETADFLRAAASDLRAKLGLTCALALAYRLAQLEPELSQFLGLGQAVSQLQEGLSTVHQAALEKLEADLGAGGAVDLGSIMQADLWGKSVEDIKEVKRVMLSLADGIDAVLPTPYHIEMASSCGVLIGLTVFYRCEESGTLFRYHVRRLARWMKLVKAFGDGVSCVVKVAKCDFDGLRPCLGNAYGSAQEAAQALEGSSWDDVLKKGSETWEQLQSWLSGNDFVEKAKGGVEGMKEIKSVFDEARRPPLSVREIFQKTALLTPEEQQEQRQELRHSSGEIALSGEYIEERDDSNHITSIAFNEDRREPKKLAFPEAFVYVQARWVATQELRAGQQRPAADEGRGPAEPAQGPQAKVSDGPREAPAPAAEAQGATPEAAGSPPRRPDREGRGFLAGSLCRLAEAQDQEIDRLRGERDAVRARALELQERARTQAAEAARRRGEAAAAAGGLEAARGELAEAGGERVRLEASAEEAALRAARLEAERDGHAAALRQQQADGAAEVAALRRRLAEEASRGAGIGAELRRLQELHGEERAAAERRSAEEAALVERCARQEALAGGARERLEEAKARAAGLGRRGREEERECALERQRSRTLAERAERLCADLEETRGELLAAQAGEQAALARAAVDSRGVEEANRTALLLTQRCAALRDEDAAETARARALLQFAQEELAAERGGGARLEALAAELEGQMARLLVERNTEAEAARARAAQWRAAEEAWRERLAQEADSGATLRGELRGLQDLQHGRQAEVERQGAALRVCEAQCAHLTALSRGAQERLEAAQGRAAGAERTAREVEGLLLREQAGAVEAAERARGLSAHLAEAQDGLLRARAEAQEARGAAAARGRRAEDAGAALAQRDEALAASEREVAGVEERERALRAELLDARRESDGLRAQAQDLRQQLGLGPAPASAPNPPLARQLRGELPAWSMLPAWSL